MWGLHSFLLIMNTALSRAWLQPARQQHCLCEAPDSTTALAEYKQIIQSKHLIIGEAGARRWVLLVALKLNTVRLETSPRAATADFSLEPARGLILKAWQRGLGTPHSLLLGLPKQTQAASMKPEGCGGNGGNGEKMFLSAREFGVCFWGPSCLIHGETLYLT